MPEMTFHPGSKSHDDLPGSTTRCIAPHIAGTILPDYRNESVALSVLRLAFDRVGLAALYVPYDRDCRQSGEGAGARACDEEQPGSAMDRSLGTLQVPC